MQIRTDLALEAAEKAPDMPRLTEQDVEKTQLMEGEATITRIHIHSGAGSEALGRAPGRYITVEVPPLSDNDDKLVEYARLIGRELAALPEGSVGRVAAALGRLPKDCGAVLELFCTGWSAAEIAEQTGLSPRTVHRRLNRARELMRKELEEDGGADG